MHETDSLTGENIIRSQRNIIVSDDGGKTGFAILGIMMDSTFILRIKTVGAGACVNYGDQIHFVFNDSSELRLTNMAQFNCEAQSSLYFNFKNNNFDALQKLSEKPIAKLTVWTKTRFISKAFNTETAEKMNNLLACFDQAFGDDTFVRLMNNSVFTRVEKQPEFEGGVNAFLKFIKANLRYPPVLRQMGGEGTVYVEFLVNKDGSITDVHTLRGFHPDADAEAERVIKLMPPWIPGSHHGKTVTVRFVMPIKFKIS